MRSRRGSVATVARRPAGRLAFVLGLLLAARVSASAETHHALATAPGGSPAAREALTLCIEDDGGRDGLARAVEIAERALAGDETDAVAHFALFCALGRQAEAAGVGALFRVRRLLREADRTLALAPDWPDAVAGKGSLLMQLPKLLGGDAAEGERLLRRAIAMDARFGGAWVELGRGLARAGRPTEARDAASRGAELADAAGDARAARRARELLRTLER